MRIEFSAAAVREADEAANWYRDRAGARVSGRLLAEIERARHLLRTQPELGTPGVVYRIEGDTVRVIAFMHQSRQPDYWKRRG